MLEFIKNLFYKKPYCEVGKKPYCEVGCEYRARIVSDNPFEKTMEKRVVIIDIKESEKTKTKYVEYKVVNGDYISSGSIGWFEWIYNEKKGVHY